MPTLTRGKHLFALSEPHLKGNNPTGRVCCPEAEVHRYYEAADYSKLNRQWNLVFDAAGKSSYQAARHVLASGGHYVSTEPSLAGVAISLATSVLSKKGRVMLARPRSKDLRELIRLVTSGKMAMHLDQVLPLAEAAEAHRRLEAGGVRGKLVLRIAEDAELQRAS